MKSRDKKGFMMAFFAILIAVIIALSAFVIDLSQVYAVKTRIKNAIDHSVLAGISQLTSQANVASAKNLALQYLNENLTMTLPSFSPLALDNSDLSIQIGVYDFKTMTFKSDELNPAVNALMITYSYNSMAIFGSVFGANNILVSDSSTSVKQIAGKMPPGGGFPLAIERAVLSQSRANANMIDLVQSGTANSFFTAFEAGNADSNKIKQIISYFVEPVSGVTPPTLTVGQEFQINNGNLTSVYMSLSESSFEGKTFISPIVKLDQGFTNVIKVEGFIGFTINDIYKSGNDYHIAGTIIPSYVDNKWSGLIVGAGPGDIPQEDQEQLAVAYGLIQ